MVVTSKQQYYGDDSTIIKVNRDMSVEPGIIEKIHEIEAKAQVNKIEKVKVNGVTLDIDQTDKSVNLKIHDTLDYLNSTSTTDALSANMGRELSEEIMHLKSIGRFLSIWNCVAGMPETQPPQGIYDYKTGDYFIIGTVAGEGGTNYRPEGTEYMQGDKSETVETEKVKTRDVYFYDGTKWALQINTVTNDYDDHLDLDSENAVQNKVVTEEINKKASDNTVVHLTGNETIAGEKTFTSNITSTGFKTSTGTSAQFLKADGSLDNNEYALKSNLDKKLDKVSTTSTKAYRVYGIDAGGDQTIIDVSNSVNSGGLVRIDDSLHSLIPTPTEDNDIANKKYVDDAIDQIEQEKTPNVTVVGTPTIVSGNISNFSTNNYLIAPFLSSFSGNPFTLHMDISTSSDVSTQQNIVDSTYGLAFAIKSAKFVIALSTNGTNWNVGEFTGSYAVKPNTDYHVEIKWDGQNVTLKYSTDGTNYTQDISAPLTTALSGKTLYFGGYGATSHPFKGTFNFNERWFKSGENVVWKGMDVAGLETRANVSLSNLDEEGEARFNGKLDKTNTAWTVYATAESGTQINAPYAINPDESSIAMRGAGGTLNVGTPTTDNQATTKKYVDDGLNNKLNKPNGTSSQFIKGDGSLDSNTYLTSFTETDPTVPAHVKSITQDNITDWNSKGTYSKPEGGIPKTDLSSDVQTSLNKADTALQSFTETDPTVPAHVKSITTIDMANWNAKGTYSKPSGGIPKSDLASSVQTSLGKADTALQSFTETDPVFSKSPAGGITTGDINNWNSKYAKPNGGIPSTDLSSVVQTSLGKADTAVQPDTLNSYATTQALNDGLNGKQDKALVTNLTNADHTHYPSAKAVSDAISNLGYGDMLKSTYDPTNKNADAFNYNNMYNTPVIVDNVKSDSSTSVLSAKQGKVLQDQIDTLEARGHFLSNWNAATGQPVSFPLATPYNYTTGDYFIVTVLPGQSRAGQARIPEDFDGPSTQPGADEEDILPIRPSGTSYTGEASTEFETEELSVGDVYTFDGQIWLLQINHGKTVSFANLSGQPSDNSNLASALNAKADATALTTHTGNSTIHVTASDKVAWSKKYDKPSDGIPKSDLDSSVQASLDKADGSIQNPSGGSNGKILTYTNTGPAWSTDNNYKKSGGELTGAVTVGTSSAASIGNAFTHKRVVESSVTGTPNNGVAFAVGADGSATFQHKTYTTATFSGGKNDAVLRFSGETGLQYAKNTTGGSMPAESDYKNVLIEPDDGTEGQILTKTATGIEWKDETKELPELGENGQVLTVSLGIEVRGPAPEGYHVPTTDEWKAVYDAGKALGQWRGTDGDSFRIKMKVPFAGSRSISSAVSNQGSFGIYWSSTAYSSSSAYNLYFTSDGFSSQGTSSHSYGYSVRPFRNSPLVPNTSWTVIYAGSNGAGIYHNANEGVISISSDGQTWITIADKNLGATQVYNDGDTLSEANCGYYYQWGNNHGFPWTGTISKTSSTKVDASAYGKGNPYSSDTWITVNPWDSSDNRSLWGMEEVKKAEWNDIEALPEGGTSGQVLTKTETGAEWSDMKSGAVYIEVDSSKTGDGLNDYSKQQNALIHQALGEGKEVILRDNDKKSDYILHNYVPGTYAEFHCYSGLDNMAFDIIQAPFGVGLPRTSKTPLPTGGTTGQVLTKTQYGSEWQDAAGGGNTETFYLSSASDKANAQKALDFYLAGNNPIIFCSGRAYYLGGDNGARLTFYSPFPASYQGGYYYINIRYSGTTVSSISISSDTATLVRGSSAYTVTVTDSLPASPSSSTLYFITA